MAKFQLSVVLAEESNPGRPVCSCPQDASNRSMFMRTACISHDWYDTVDLMMITIVYK